MKSCGAWKAAWVAPSVIQRQAIAARAIHRGKLTAPILRGVQTCCVTTPSTGTTRDTARVVLSGPRTKRKGTLVRSRPNIFGIRNAGTLCLRSFSRRRSQRRMSVVLRLLYEMVFGGDNCRCLVSMCPVSIQADSFSAF
jgi:hypothetical protein